MELRHLRYCIAVAEAGSFTRAAAGLRLAQQALSKQIADLERELGVKLFERRPRGAAPTAAGVAFVEDARAVLAQTLRAVRRARAETDGGSLRLGYSYLTPPHLLAFGELIARFHRAHPGTTVDVEHLPTGAQPAALRDGTIDIAFGYLPSADSGDTAGELLADDAIVGVILPAGHPAALRRPLWLRDLDDLPMVAPPRDLDPVAYDLYIAALAERGVRPKLAVVHAIGPPAMSVVADGCWQLVAGSARPPIAAEPRIVFRRFADPPIPFGLWVRCRREVAPRLVHEFIALCRELREAECLPAITTLHPTDRSRAAAPSPRRGRTISTEERASAG